MPLQKISISITPNQIILRFPDGKFKMNTNSNHPNFTPIEIDQTFKDEITIIACDTLFGVILLQGNWYLAVVQESELVGCINTHEIYKVLKMEMICLGNKQSERDQNQCQQIMSALSLFSLYFSLTENLPNDPFLHRPSPNTPFCINAEWLPFADSLRIPRFICGHVNFANYSLDDQQIKMCILSRENTKRLGRRWFCRGADQDGNTANTLQTWFSIEIKNIHGSRRFIYNQLRGSIPLIWQQYPNLSFSPKITICQNEEKQLNALSNHYNFLKSKYQRSVLLNLIDKNGQQSRLGNLWNTLHDQLKRDESKLIWFDFHAQRKGNSYEALQNVWNLIEEDLREIGYYEQQMQENGENTKEDKAELKLIRSQNGIVRTNCVDCLDRTNVMQALICRKLALQWLSKHNISLNPILQEKYNQLWLSNADSLSMQYTGTPAMKTDLLRNGKRTIGGALKDGLSGATRWIKGQFKDYQHQNNLDLYNGKMSKKQKNEKGSTGRSLLGMLSAMFVCSIPIGVISCIEYYFPDNSNKLAMQIGGSCILTLIGGKIVQSLHKHILQYPIINQQQLMNQ